MLVVDDHPSHCRILQAYLRNWGMRCDTANRPAAALISLVRAALAGDPYEIAIIDMVMDDMDGLALARAIHADASLAPTQLIMLTAFDEKGRSQEALAPGTPPF